MQYRRLHLRADHGRVGLELAPRSTSLRPLDVSARRPHHHRRFPCHGLLFLPVLRGSPGFSAVLSGGWLTTCGSQRCGWLTSSASRARRRFNWGAKSARENRITLTASCRGRGSTDLWHGGSATRASKTSRRCAHRARGGVAVAGLGPGSGERRTAH